MFKYRQAYVEYSGDSHESHRLTDYNAWSHIASLKEDQKARVLEALSELLQEARTRQPSNQDFGRWCDEQGFGLNRTTLFRYRLAYTEYSFVDAHVQQRLTDYNAWSHIASLKEDQKARVLEILGGMAKPTRKDVEAAIAEVKGRVCGIFRW